MSDEFCMAAIYSSLDVAKFFEDEEEIAFWTEQVQIMEAEMAEKAKAAA